MTEKERETFINNMVREAQYLKPSIYDGAFVEGDQLFKGVVV